MAWNVCCQPFDVTDIGRFFGMAANNLCVCSIYQIFSGNQCLKVICLMRLLCNAKPWANTTHDTFQVDNWEKLKFWWKLWACRVKVKLSNYLTKNYACMVRFRMINLHKYDPPNTLSPFYSLAERRRQLHRKYLNIISANISLTSKTA